MLVSNLLHGPRIRLTAVTLDDLPTIARWNTDPGFARMFEANPAAPKASGALEPWLEGYTRSNNGYLFGVRLLDDDELLGFIELNDIFWPHRNSWVSIAIGDAANQ